MGITLCRVYGCPLAEKAHALHAPLQSSDKHVSAPKKPWLPRGGRFPEPVYRAFRRLRASYYLLRWLHISWFSVYSKASTYPLEMRMASSTISR
ncbi:protein of unknown function (plasmid) [Caballeronia sp. S22]